jgi:transcriptional regulator with XRE-family HTH domain
MPLADRVRTLRQERGLTQAALARAANLRLSHVTRIEHGIIPDPQWSTVQALARGLQVAVTALQHPEPEAGEEDVKAEVKPRRRKKTE